MANRKNETNDEIEIEEEGYWILVGTETRPVTLTKWAEWCETADRRIGDNDINGYRVSTVMLGLDHSFGIGPPLLFETMVFRKDGTPGEDEYCERYSTYYEALLGHLKACQMAKRGDFDKEGECSEEPE